MKKILIIGLTVLAVAGVSQADLTWGYSANLLDFDATIQSGWLVQMYQDVNSDSSLGTISFNTSGVASGTGASDDTLLASFSASLVENAKSGAIDWADNFSSWSSLYDDDVYSVLYNAASIGSASKSVIIDASPNTLPGSDPGTYTMSSVNNSWQAVPEPATALLFGVGGMGAFIIRRNKLKKMEEDEA